MNASKILKKKEHEKSGAAYKMNPKFPKKMVKSKPVAKVGTESAAEEEMEGMGKA